MLLFSQVQSELQKWVQTQNNKYKIMMYLTNKEARQYSAAYSGMCIQRYDM